MSQGSSEISWEALGMKTVLAKVTSHSCSKALPRVPPHVRPNFKLLEEGPLLLDQRNLVRRVCRLGLMKEVGLVREKDVHPRGSNTKHVPGVLIDVLLQIKDLLVAGGLCKGASQPVGILLEGLSVAILLLLLLGEEEWAYLSKVFRIQALVKVREQLISSSGLPCLPNPMVEDGHMHFLLAVQSQVLEAIEDGPALGGLTWTDALESRHPSLGEDLMHAEHENVTFVSHVLAGWCHRQRNGMLSRDGEGFLHGPGAFMLKGAHAPFLDVEDGLHHTPLPEFRFRARSKPLLPLLRDVLDFALPKPALPEQVGEGEILPAEWAMTLLPMESALMKRPESRSVLLRHLLQSQTDLPIQRPFQVVASLVPGQSEETLPPEFSLQLVEKLRPAILEAQDAVWNATITCPPEVVLRRPANGSGPFGGLPKQHSSLSKRGAACSHRKSDISSKPSGGAAG